MGDIPLLVSLVIVLFGLALAIALLLMPFFVIGIHGELQKIRRLLEEMAEKNKQTSR